MQYHEFLRLAGATKEACPYRFYTEKIEPAYMDNDDLFPTKEDVAAYWRDFGPIAFSSEWLALVSRAVTAVRNCCYFQSGLRRGMRRSDGDLEAWIVKAAGKRCL